MSNRENFSFVLFFITTRHVTIILYWFEPSLEITFNASSFVIYRYIMHWWGMFFVPTKWPISHLVSTRHIPHWGLNTHDSSFQMTFFMHFLRRKYLHCDSNFTRADVYKLWTLHRQQAITKPNDDKDLCACNINLLLSPKILQRHISYLKLKWSYGLLSTSYLTHTWVNNCHGTHIANKNSTEAISTDKS